MPETVFASQRCARRLLVDAEVSQQSLADVRTEGLEADSPLMARPFPHLLPKRNMVRGKLQARKLDRLDSNDVITCVQGSQD